MSVVMVCSLYMHIHVPVVLPSGMILCRVAAIRVTLSAYSSCQTGVKVHVYVHGMRTSLYTFLALLTCGAMDCIPHINSITCNAAMVTHVFK